MATDSVSNIRMYVTASLYFYLLYACYTYAAIAMPLNFTYCAQNYAHHEHIK